MSETLQNQLIHGDCFKELPKIPSDSIDLIITDPPYGVNYKSRNRKDNKLKQFKDENIDFVFLLNEFFRILKPNSHCYIFSGYRTLDKILPYIGKFNFKNILVIKGKGTVAVWNSDNFSNNYELCLFLMKGKRNLNELKNVKSKYYGRDPRQKHPFKRTVPNLIDWFYPSEWNGKMIHPTQKNHKLIEYLIKLSSKSNEIVLDPFAGSGTLGIACLNTERNFICIELEDEYFLSMKERIEQHKKQTKLNLEEFQ